MIIVGLDLSLAGTGIARLEASADPQLLPIVTWAVKGTAAHAHNPKVKPDHLWQCERNGVTRTFRIVRLSVASGSGTNCLEHACRPSNDGLG